MDLFGDLQELVTVHIDLCALTGAQFLKYGRYHSPADRSSGNMAWA